MKENTLLKIAIICSLVGLFVLYFISEKVEVADYKPSQVNRNVGDTVKLTGKILKISEKRNVAFIELSQQSSVSIVLFTDKNVNLKQGDSVEVIGKVQEYNGKNEIIADRIRLVK